MLFAMKCSTNIRLYALLKYFFLICRYMSAVYSSTVHITPPRAGPQDLKEQHVDCQEGVLMVDL